MHLNTNTPSLFQTAISCFLSTEALYLEVIFQNPSPCLFKPVFSSSYFCIHVTASLYPAVFVHYLYMPVLSQQPSPIQYGTLNPHLPSWFRTGFLSIITLYYAGVDITYSLYMELLTNYLFQQTEKN